MKPGDLVLMSSEYRMPHPVIIISISPVPDPCIWLQVLTSSGIQRVNAAHAKLVNETR
jgi:hypothetical protein